MENDDVMTSRQVADYLRIDVATVRRLARDGLIPAVHLGRKWRFMRTLIDRWAAELSSVKE